MMKQNLITNILWNINNIVRSSTCLLLLSKIMVWTSNCYTYIKQLFNFIKVVDLYDKILMNLVEENIDLKKPLDITHRTML
jgi:hypothetical protein